VQTITCNSQFTAFEPFRKIAFSIDSCASTIDAFTLCKYKSIELARSPVRRIWYGRFRRCEMREGILPAASLLLAAILARGLSLKLDGPMLGRAWIHPRNMSPRLLCQGCEDLIAVGCHVPQGIGC